jgi:two-component system, NtrC family, response regulator
MQKVYNLTRVVAKSNASVLLLGETGTGKEVFARALHEESNRRDQPFIAINCSSFSNELLKSELFGHVAGAFTGAMKDKKGLFEEADGGTLFMDEIGEMNIELQAKLLRVLEDGSFNRLGESKSRKVNARIIAATNKNLKEEALNNHFRLDLYYRLAVFTIQLPPLRERPEDIELLAKHFLDEYSSRFKRKITGMDEGFIRALKNNAWKGNVRELRNVIERAVITASKDILTREQLDMDFFSDQVGNDKRTLNLESIEKQYIQKAMNEAKGNKTEAARLLGIGLSTLYRKLEEYRL